MDYSIEIERSFKCDSAAHRAGAIGRADIPDVGRQMTDSIKFSFILSECRSSPVKAANADTNARLPASPPNAMAAHFAKLSIGDGKAEASADSSYRILIPPPAARRPLFVRRPAIRGHAFNLACRDK
jgi:hypothetical protein